MPKYDENMGLEPEEVTLIKESFKTITYKDGEKIIISEFIRLFGKPFYKNLFDIEPSLEPYFKHKKHMQLLFSESVELLVDNLGTKNKEEEIMDIIEAHNRIEGLKYTNKQFNDIGAALTITLEEVIDFESLYKVVNEIENKKQRDNNKIKNLTMKSWVTFYNNIRSIMEPKMVKK